MTEPAKPCVLVVDDEPRNRALLRSWLEARHRVVEAADGPAALAAAGEADLVLLDVMMPGMSGFQVCHALKAGGSGPFRPVVLVTALGEQEDRNAGLEAGADEFLTKPVDRRELLLRVRTLLRVREQDRLIRAQLAHLQRLSDLKDDLFSLVVHDLRNPLAGMLALLEGARERTDGALREDLDVATRAAGRVGGALDDILEIRVLEDGRLPLSAEPTLLRGLLADAAEAAAPAARARGVGITTVDASSATPRVDARLVRRAVENLVGNAVKYSPAGTTVAVTARDLPGAVEISVRDHGPGLSGDARAHLFEKFGVVAGRRTGARRGFGLGLYLVHLVAEAHGGDVAVLDPPEGGTELRLRLPVSRASA